MLLAQGHICSKMLPRHMTRSPQVLLETSQCSRTKMNGLNVITDYIADWLLIETNPMPACQPVLGYPRLITRMWGGTACCILTLRTGQILLSWRHAPLIRWKSLLMVRIYVISCLQFSHVHSVTPDPRVTPSKLKAKLALDHGSAFQFGP